MLNIIILINFHFYSHYYISLFFLEKMYHQVKVPEEDQAALRFIYRSPGSQTAPLTYQMTVHVFGAVSSPTTCIFALNKAASDNRERFPEAAHSVQ